MRQYLLKRLLLTVVVALGATMVIFVALRVLPGDVALAILGQEGSADREALEAIRRSLGLDRPLYQQYLAWLGDLLRLEGGESLWRGVPVRELVGPKLAVTFELALLSLVASVALGLLSGGLSALHRNTWLDYLFRLFTLAGLALPGFWVGILVVLGLVLYFNYFPFPYYKPFTEDPLGNLQQFLFPALVLGWRMAAVTGRMVRSSLLEVLREDYIRTARAKGLGEWGVVFGHALKNAALPVVTVVGFQTAHLLGGVVVIEEVFNLPGLGRELVEALRARDYPVVQFLVLLFAGVTMLANLAVDLFYSWLDPRIRYR
jgi:peptide/nickel transport system permease protein